MADACFHTADWPPIIAARKALDVSSTRARELLKLPIYPWDPCFPAAIGALGRDEVAEP